MAMATNRIVLFQLGTLCFVLFMLLPAAHGKKGSGVLMLSGTARCKSNPSRTINNATLEVTINGTMVATGETNSSGQFLLVANVTSRDQLMALIKKEVAFTAPSGACGGAVPAAAAAGRKLAAAADDDVDITGLAMVMSIDELVDDILNSPPVDDADLPPEVREEIMAFLDQDSKSINMESLINLLEGSGVAAYDLVNRIMDFVGIPSIYKLPN